MSTRFLTPVPFILLLAAAAIGTTTGAHTASAQSANAQATRPVWPDEGPLKWAPRPTTTEITANDLRTRIYGLADDSMMGRRTGEPGNFVATTYIANEFKRLGLKPGGDNGTYFQVLPWGFSGFDVAAARLTIGGKALKLRTEWIPTIPSAATRAGSLANWSNIPTVFAGQLGDTTTLDPARFKGKIAVFLAAQSAGPGAVGGRGFGGPLVSCSELPNKFGAAAIIAAEANAAAGRAGGRAGGARFQGGAQQTRDIRAVQAGAAGVLIIGLDNMAPNALNTALAQRGGMQPAANSAQTNTDPAQANISRAVAEQLFGTTAAQLTFGKEGKPVSASFEYAWRPTTSPARNVIAILPGSDPARAHEYVLVGAHNDHMGVNATPVDHDSLRAVNTVTRRQGANDPACTPTADQQRRIDSLIRHARSIRPPRLDSIMNGADDDGSGTGVLLEIAERFATEKPARSIIFISHQGEEAGLLGSRWFVEHPTVKLSDIVAAHNMDMLGKGRTDQVMFGGPNSVQSLGSRRLSREFGDIIDSVNAVIKEPMAIDKSWDVPANPMNRFCRSDQVNYVTHNIPVTYFSLGYAQDYHMLTDEPQYIEYEHSARLGRFIYEVMTAIANRADRPAITGDDPAYPRCGR